MKKTLLSLACALAVAGGTAKAQVNEQYTDVRFSSLSPNGKYLVENNNLTLSILDRTTGKTYVYSDPDGISGYSLGLGKAVTDEGVVVGSGMEGAMIWNKGTLSTLPQLSGAASGLNIANAVTPDARYIAGMLAPDGAGMGGDGIMGYPALWTLQADGSYVCEELSYPSKDFFGQTPQYISLIDIADDGATAIAHVADWSGFYHYALLYRKTASGTWTYSILAPELVFDADKVAALPAAPGDAPTEPAVEDYMTDSEKAAYNAALEEYEELFEQYANGLIPDEPPYPVLKDYFLNADGVAAYKADSTQFDAENTAYWTYYDNYIQLRAEAVTGASWVQNSEKLSANGHYVTANLQRPDPENPDPVYGNKLTTPVRFDLTGETLKVEQIDANDEISVGIMDNGALLTASPATEYTRNTYYVAPGDTKPVHLAEYLASRSEEAAKFLKDNYTFDVTKYTYDEQGNQVPELVTDSLVTGTVTCNPAGTIFVGYLDDSFTVTTQTTTLSYIIDLNEGAVAAIGGVKHDGEPAVLRREFYNLQGQRIAEPATGVYLEKVFTAEGAYTVKRIK